MKRFAIAAGAALALAALAAPAQAATSTRDYVVYVQHCNQHGYNYRTDYTALPVHRTYNGAFARMQQIDDNWRRVRALEIHDLSGKWVAHWDADYCGP